MTDDVDAQVDILTSVFTSCLDHCAPVVTSIVNKPWAPWLNDEIRSAMATRNALQTRLKRDRRNAALQEQYKYERFDIEVLIPDNEQRARVHKVIFDELCLGNFNDSSKAEYLQIVDSLYNRGAQGVILGCTEIGLLIQQQDTSVTLFDTTALHVQSAIDFALSE